MRERRIPIWLFTPFIAVCLIAFGNVAVDLPRAIEAVKLAEAGLLPAPTLADYYHLFAVLLLFGFSLVPVGLWYEAGRWLQSSASEDNP